MAELFSDVRDKQRDMRIALWARRATITALTAVALAGLLDVFGQGTSTATSAGPAATLRVDAPDRVRGGLYFQTRIEVRARAGIERPRLIFDPDVFEGMQVSSIEPAAMSESSRDGRVELSYPAIRAGELLRVWMQFQVNPTYAGRRHYRVDLDEGTTRLATVDRTLDVLP
jgi:hypothetical protein